MIGKGGRDVKHELSLLCLRHRCRCFTTLHVYGTSLDYRQTHSLEADTTARRQVSRRRHLDGDTIINGLTNLLAHAASHAPLLLDNKPQRMKIHLQCVNRALRYTGMAPLPCRTRAMRHGRKPHPNLEGIGHRQERICRTGSNAGEIFTELTGNLVGKNHRRAVGEITDDGTGGTGFDAIRASRAALKKHRFVDGPRGTQPVRPDRGSRLLAGRILVDGKLPRSFRNRDDGVFQKIATPVFRITSHDALQLHHTVGPQLIDFYATIAGAILDIPTRVILTNEVQNVPFKLRIQVFHPCVRREPAQGARESGH